MNKLPISINDVTKYNSYELIYNKSSMECLKLELFNTLFVIYINSLVLLSVSFLQSTTLHLSQHILFLQ
jgi:hypothetical protein